MRNDIELTLKQRKHGFNIGFEYKNVCPTITISSFEHNNFLILKYMGRKLPKELEGKKFKIRRLTPRECFRLMGVDDKDIDTIQATGISNSAQYKLAGNSIVVDVLYHIFRKMFIETENENQELTLF